MKNTRLVVLLVIGALLIGGAAVYKLSYSKRVQSEALAMAKTADARKLDTAYYDTILEAARPAAARAGGGGLFSKFDAEAYYTALFQAMMDQAVKDGKEDIARSVRAFAVGKGYLNVRMKS